MFSLAGVIIAMMMAVEEPPKEYVGEVTISAYSVNEGYGENRTTASGKSPTPYKTIATSDEYPFGTKLYIDGIGECVVEDRGGNLISSGERIDLFVGEDNPNDFGLQKRKVYEVK